jgi:hypothetical protein
MRQQQHGGQNWRTIMEDGLVIVSLALVGWLLPVG